MTNKLQITLRLIVAMLLVSAIAACSPLSTKVNPIKIKRLIFINKSLTPLKNVRIFIVKTNEVVVCGYILSKTECSTGFSLREYKGNRFDVFWMDGVQQKSVTNVLVEIPKDLSLDKPVNAVIVFGEQGKFSARLQH